MEEVPKVNQITIKTIIELFERQSKDYYKILGGLEGFADKFGTDLNTGLTSQTDYKRLRKLYGENILPDPPSKSWWYYFWHAFQALCLQILFFSAIVSLILTALFPAGHGDSTHARWLDFVDTIAIFLSILVVCLIEAQTNYLQQQSFKEINKLKNSFNITVIRDSEEKQIPNIELYVGDILSLKSGDRIAADSLYISGHNLKVDNSSETGESVAVSVHENNPFLLGGAAIESGDAHALVCAIGPNSQGGVNMTKIQEMDQEVAISPLEQKLKRVTLIMTWIGVFGALLTLIVLLIRWGIDISKDGWSNNKVNILVGHIMVGITIFICAVPEGLPLSVTLSLAFSMKSMVRDNCFVRQLSACETMGGITTICSDKTGTLTQNEMTVVKFVMNKTMYDDIPKTNENVKKLLCEAIACNTSSYWQAGTADKPGKFIGQSSECALLKMIYLHYEADYKRLREANPICVLHEFNSTRKRMSTIVRYGSKFRIFAKGAPDYMISRCSHYLTEEGDRIPLDVDSKNEICDHVIEMADNALRTLLIAYSDIDADDVQEEWQDSEAVEYNLTMIGIAGIIDPLRPEVVGAIEQCKRAGVIVRMVTGDYINTAKAIARECGIYNDEGVAITGEDFSKNTKPEVATKLPKIQVMGRSSPRDKYRLVGLLMEMGEVVAVTGDGSNDSPALKRANVGLAMGKCGTELAKMASDIVILDDNFATIVSALKWGRCIYDNVRSFLVYQLVVNFSAIGLGFIGALVFESSPLKPLQILWINLINGPCGALSYSTSKPVDSLLDRPPYGISDFVVNNIMIRDTIGSTIYQFIVLFVVLFLAKDIFGWESDDKLKRETIVFNTYVYCEVFNLINCRTTSHKGSPYDGIFKNPYFLVILIGLLIVQFIVTQFCGTFFVTSPLGYKEWIYSLASGFVILIIGFILRLFRLKDLTVETMNADRKMKAEAINKRYAGLSPEETWDLDSANTKVNPNDLVNP